MDSLTPTVPLLKQEEIVESRFPKTLDQSEKLAVVVPCYNEARTIGSLLERVRKALPMSQIIVVDDGSNDDSAVAIEELEKALDLVVIRQSNSGKGAAFRRGLEAVSRQYVIIQDGDLEYNPEEINLLLSKAIDENYRAVYGSRYLAGRRNGQLLNYWAVKTLGLVIWWRFGRRLSDPCTCYKLFETSLLKRWKLHSQKFELCQELNRKLIESENATFCELPIGYDARGKDAGKKIRWTDFFASLRELLRRD